MAEENQTTILSGDSNGKIDPLGDGARERIKKRGRPRTSSVDQSATQSRDTVLSAKTEEEIAKYQEAMQRLFSPSSWERVICAPFDAALLATGAPEFNIPKDVRADLGADMALVLQFWGGGFDPKYLVLVKASADLASVMGNCWLAYKTRKLEEHMAEKRKNGDFS